MHNTTLSGITGVILAGGRSTRMGTDKALLEVHGQCLIDRVHTIMSDLFDDRLLVTNTPERYAFLSCPTVPDSFLGEGSLAGIHAALVHARTERVFVVACDMPLLSPEVIRFLCNQSEGHDIVVPCSAYGTEPLHALYHRNCLPVIELMLQQGKRRIVELFDAVQTHRVEWRAIANLPGAATTFQNINTPEDFNALYPSPCNTNTPQ